jgi:hypothetical protein
MTQTKHLAAVDRRTVAAHLVIQGREQLLRGKGVYEDDPDLGGVLRIQVADPSGDFELLLVEDQWTGTLQSGAALGCDYLVRL